MTDIYAGLFVDFTAGPDGVIKDLSKRHLIEWRGMCFSTLEATDADMDTLMKSPWVDIGTADDASTSEEGGQVQRRVTRSSKKIMDTPTSKQTSYDKARKINRAEDQTNVNDTLIYKKEKWDVELIQRQFLEFLLTEVTTTIGTDLLDRTEA